MAAARLKFQKGGIGLNFAVCDDSPADAAYVCGAVKTWAAARGIKAGVRVFPSAENFLFEGGAAGYDVLLLDIEMGRMNGVELAQQVRKTNRGVSIIFVTGYMDYISDGYDVEALHYLLKPVTPLKLAAVLDRAEQRLQSAEKALLIPCDGENVRIPLCDIRYIEADGNYITVYAGGKSYLTRMTLASAEKEVGDGFFRAGRSCIINLRFVLRTGKTSAVLKTGETVPLPRGAYEQLNRALINYF